MDKQVAEEVTQQVEQDIPIIFYPSAEAYERSKEAKGALITNALAITESTLYEMLKGAVLHDMAEHTKRIKHEDTEKK